MAGNALKKALAKATKAELVDMVVAASGMLTSRQARDVLGDYHPDAAKLRGPSGVKALVERVRRFHRDSLAGHYYAPFDMNSKNFSHVPEETEDWADEAGELIKATCEAAKAGNHDEAAECFRLLYDVLEAVDCGKDVIFAEESGTWMVHMEESQVVRAYLKSLAKVASEEDFTKEVTRRAKRDRIHSSGRLGVLEVAQRVATKAQRAHLEAAGAGNKTP